MKKILVIAQRECEAMVATKTFLITLVMMPIFMLGGIIIMPLVNKISGGRELKIIVADESGNYISALQQAADQRNRAIREQAEAKSENGKDDLEESFAGADRWIIEPAEPSSLTDEKRLELSDKIRNGEIYAYVEIPADIASMSPESEAAVTFVSQDGVLSAARGWLSSMLNVQVRTQRLQQLDIDPTLVAKADAPVTVKTVPPLKRGGDGEAKEQDSLAGVVALFLPFGVMMLMFVVIFLAAQPMLESGMEEKTQRIAEVLLGSVTPTQLMSGKLIGNIAGSLLIFILYGVCGLVVVQRNGWDAQLPWSLMPWFVVFQLLGVVFFSSIFLTIGASIRDLKEAQGMLLPVWLVLMAPMMVWFVAVRDPNGAIATTLSFFPPSTPMMMVLRLSSGQTVPVWQPYLAAGGMLIASGCVVWLAGRIYRVSLLSNDSPGSILGVLKRATHST